MRMRRMRMRMMMMMMMMMGSRRRRRRSRSRGGRTKTMMTLANFENRDAFGANGFQNVVVLQLLSFVIVCYHFLLHEECDKFFDSEYHLILVKSRNQDLFYDQLLAGVPCILPTSSQSGSGQLPHCREHSVRCVSTTRIILHHAARPCIPCLHSLLAFIPSQALHFLSYPVGLILRWLVPELYFKTSRLQGKKEICSRF